MGTRISRLVEDTTVHMPPLRIADLRAFVVCVTGLLFYGQSQSMHMTRVSSHAYHSTAF